MSIFRFLQNRFSEPSTWSLGMCGIAVVMLLVALSQHGSFTTHASQVEKASLVSVAPQGGSVEVSHAVANELGENSKALPREITPECCGSEPFPQAENSPAIDESQRKFQRYVRLAMLASMTNNERLSAYLLAKARVILFGFDELE